MFSVPRIAVKEFIVYLVEYMQFPKIPERKSLPNCIITLSFGGKQTVA